MKSRLFMMVGSLAWVASTQLAAGEGKPHFQIKVVPRRQNRAVSPDTNAPPTANLYGLEAGFTATAYPAENSDLTDLWPCLGDSTTPNLDCAVIGDPTVTFPTGGVALGAPQYVWSLAACDGTTNGSSVGGSPIYVACGQTETWYEDDTGDSTDDVVYKVVVTQGSGATATTLADSGLVDFGPNIYGGLTPPADVVIYADQNFGALGETGQNNGNCMPDTNYPTSLPPTLYPIITAADKTCVDPAPGLTTITATTEVATPTWTKKGKKFSVTYAVKYSVKQSWKIWLQ